MRKQIMIRRILTAGMISTAICCASFPAMAGSTVVNAGITDPTGDITVTYDNLEQLLVAGNLDLQQKNDSYLSNKKNYQAMLEELRSEQAYMKFLAEQSEEDSEEETVYRSNAAVLAASATRISKQIERLNSRSNRNSAQENIDSYLVTAQTRMISYNQMALNAAAKEKSTAAAESTWKEMLKRQSAGMATADDVLEAADQYSQQKNLLTSYRQQEREQRRQLLALLGISDTESAVMIGTVPEPDLAAIDAIDFETDRQKAIGNNSSVQSARHANAGTTSEIERKFQKVAEAEGSAESDIVDSYQQLLAERSSYMAAVDAYQSAELTYQALQRKKQAGMLDNTSWLQGEAAYLQAVADYGTASMGLVQAYEDYRWAVKGVSGGR